MEQARHISDGATTENNFGDLEHYQASSLSFYRVKIQLFSNRQKHPLDFLEPAFGVLFRETRVFSTKRDEIILARDF